MAKTNDAFSALSLKDRAELLNIYVKSGMMDLKEIKAHYNSLYEEKEPNKYGWGGASKEALGKAFGDASSAASSVTGIAGSAMTMVSNGMENAEINTTEADNAIEAVKSYKLDNSSLDALASSYNATPWAATDYDSSDFTKSGWEIAGNTFESTLSGITTGASVGGPWGAVIGGLAGLGSGLIGWGIGESKAEEAERRLEAEAKKANRAIELNAVNTRDSILQKQANNTLRNIAADGGEVETKENSPIKDIARDLAYQIIVQKGVSDKGKANIGEIITGIANTEPIVDDNKKMFLYGNINGLYPASDDKGFDFTSYLQQNYPDRNIQSYQGKINPYNEYVFDEKNKGLIEELAKKGQHIYSNADDEYVQHIQLPHPDTRNNPTVEFMDVGYRDDVHSYPLKFDVDSNGNPIAHAADLYDFNAKEYLKEFKPFKALQAHLLTSVGNPYILRQDNIPVKFIDLNGKSDYSPRVNYNGSIYDNDLTDEERRAVNFNWILKNITDEKVANILDSGYIEPAVVTPESKKANGGKLKFDKGGPILNTPYNNSFLYQPETETVEEPVVENTYTVKQGDSLSKIANSFNIPLELLKKENPMKDYNRISIGQTLQIPKYEQPKQPVITEDFDVYNVKSGDTLSKIAKDNNTSVSKLLQINPQIKNQNIINIGDSINIRKNVKPDEVQKTWVDVEDLREQEKEFNKSNLGAIQGYKHDSNYVVVDKKGKKLTVYNANNEKVYETSDISTGLSGDDYNTVTYTKKVNGKDVIDHGKGNMSTPAGITKISSITDYHGAPAFQRARLNDEGNIRRVKDSETGELIDDNVASSFHSGKTSAIYSSNGCVRMSNKALKELSQYIDVGTTCYTLPDKEGSRFVLKDGNLNFEADNPFGLTEKNVKFNAYGKDMESHDDYNVHIDRRSTPIKIEHNGWDGLLGVRGDNIEKLIDGIVSNKEALQKAFKISDQHYNKIAHIALGLIGQESKYGTHRDYIAKKVLSSYDMGNILNEDHKKETGVSALDIVKYIKGNNTYNSLGVGQIKIEGDNEETQRYYKMFGVTPENVYSDEKTAEAIMIRLLSMYNNEVRGRKFKNKETDHVIDSYDALLYLYKGGELAKKLRNGEAIGKNTYIDNIKNYMKNFKIYTYK